MPEYYLVALVVLLIIAIFSYISKNNKSKMAPVIFVAAAIGALIAGMGLRIRELVEGPFAYLDSVLAVMSGMIFVMMLMFNGTFDSYFNKIISKKRSNFVQSLLLILFIALPGIFTGSATACLLTTGVIAGKYLLAKGVEKVKTIEFVTISSLIGMILPPICLPTMVIVVSRSGSYPASFEGYTLPLLLSVIPALLVYAYISSKWLGSLEAETVQEDKKTGFYNLPIIVVLVLLIGHNFLYRYVPFLGYPFIFSIGTILAILASNKKTGILESMGDGIKIISPIIAVTFAVGSALEILTLVGFSGTLATVFYTSNAIVVTIIFLIIIVLSGVIVGDSFAYIISVIGSYLVGAIAYGGDELLLTAISLALCIAICFPARGGFIAMAANSLGIKDVQNKKIISESIIPIVLILAMGVVYSLAYNKLLFLFI